MLIVGLTGGIGTGKSTVASLFAKRGVPVIDADVIARDLTKPYSPALLDIVDHFDEQLLQEDGSLDRAKLRKIIFADDSERRWLEALLHPLIRDEIAAQLKKIDAPYCIVVIPLLFEVEPYPFINKTLVVDATEELQIERVAARDKSSKHHVEAILNTQLARPARLSLADDIIQNTGSPKDLDPQVEALHQKYSDSR